MPRQCVGGFIQTHLDYTIHQQSPRSFHTWVAIGIISAALGRRVWIDRSYYMLYPNLYIVLVSPSGVGNKGTALTQGIELLDLTNLPTNILKGKISSTRLITRLSASALQNPDGFAELFIFSREFKVFTKGVMRDSSLIEDLTDLYDNNSFDYETEHSVRQQIKRPCLQILGASTPEWLSGGNAGDIMSGGFGARVLPIVVVKDEKDIAWPQKTPVEIALQPKLLADLEEIGGLGGSFYVTQQAKDFFEKWYLKRRDHRRILDSRLDGYYSKKHDQMLKLAMVLSASQSSEKVVDVTHIQAALYLLEENEKTIIHAYSGIAATKEIQYRDQVVTKIKEKGELSHTDLAQYFYHGLGRDGLRSLLAGLIEEKLIRGEQRKGKTKPYVVYVWTGDEDNER